MEELNTENLQALLRGEELNNYQKSLANQEYKDLIFFAYEAKKQVKKFNISAVVKPFYCHEQEGNGLRCETQCLGCDGTERDE